MKSARKRWSRRKTADFRKMSGLFYGQGISLPVFFVILVIMHGLAGCMGGCG